MSTDLNPKDIATSATTKSGLQLALVSATAAIIGAALTFAGVYSTGWFTRQSKDDELRVELVKIAVGILAIKKADGEAQPRNWAIDVMERNTGVNMSAEEKKILVDLGGLKGTSMASLSKQFGIIRPAADGSSFSCYYNEATGAYDDCTIIPKTPSK